MVVVYLLIIELNYKKRKLWYLVPICILCNIVVVVMHAVHSMLIDRQYLIDLEECQRMRTNYNQVVVFIMNRLLHN